MSRFDYVAFDQDAADEQAEGKMHATALEQFINSIEGSSRAKALALTKLEECYMWIGKAIRDAQVERQSLINRLKQSQT